MWLCKCDCGKTKTIVGSELTGGGTVSCGCVHITHGGSGTAEYIAWTNLLSRCKNKNHPSYKNYGGRGITVCEEWDKFERFLSDMKERPSSKHSIDRIDNDGDYEITNCRWVTWNIQMSNKRKTGIKLSYNDVSMIKTLLKYKEKGKDIAVLFGVHKNTISSIKTGKIWAEINCQPI